MKISLFRGGYTNLVSNELIESFDEFCDLVSTPSIGAKNGDYFVRGFCQGKRNDDNIQHVSLIIIDGDQLVNFGSGCCPPDGVHDVMKTKDIRHVIYSSYSNNIINNIHKWRLCVPCDDIVDETSLRQGVREILSILHSEGFSVKNVKENEVMSQPWFTPRCPEGMEDDFFCKWHDGKKYKLCGKTPLKSTMIGVECKNSKTGNDFFSWDYVIDQFSSGTVHNGLKSGIGWLVHTTDWVDSQIKSFFQAQVKSLCPDTNKVNRVIETNEIDRLIKFCREKHGVIEHVANWKDNLIAGDKLKNKNFPPIKWAVDGVIPEGLTVLAGDPKAGKSLMAIDICDAISSGGDAFGKCRCVEGESLYVSLEDPQRRVKERLLQRGSKFSNKFKLVTKGISELGKEFYKQMDEILIIMPELRCVVIDTMSFIIPKKPSGLSDYDHYYKCLDPLHTWSIDNHVSVILITHTTKSQGVDGDNPFSRIIGSVAIQGTADAMILLSRNHAKILGGDEIADGFLTISGREVGQEKYALNFDEELLTWVIRGELRPEDTGLPLNYFIILQIMPQDGSGVTAAEIIKETGKNRNTINSCLRRMVNKGLIEKREKYFFMPYIDICTQKMSSD